MTSLKVLLTEREYLAVVETLEEEVGACHNLALTDFGPEGAYEDTRGPLLESALKKLAGEAKEATLTNLKVLVYVAQTRPPWIRAFASKEDLLDYFADYFADDPSDEERLRGLMAADIDAALDAPGECIDAGDGDLIALVVLPQGEERVDP